MPLSDVTLDIFQYHITSTRKRKGRIPHDSCAIAVVMATKTRCSWGLLTTTTTNCFNRNKFVMYISPVSKERRKKKTWTSKAASLLNLPTTTSWRDRTDAGKWWCWGLGNLPKHTGKKGRWSLKLQTYINFAENPWLCIDPHRSFQAAPLLSLYPVAVVALESPPPDQVWFLFAVRSYMSWMI